MTTDQTKTAMTCACCGRAVTGSLCCPKLLGSASGAKCPEHAPDHRAEAERMSAVRPAVAEVHALLSIDARLARLDDTLRTILCWEELPEEVLARVKAETLEKAAQEGEAPSLADLDLISGEGAAAYLRLAMAVQDATVVAQPAQTLADLTPCLGGRVRVVDEFIRSEREVTFTWIRAQRDFGWLDDAGNQCARPDQWPVLEHLDPVTPEEPPVGAGMLVDRDRALWRHDKDGWRFNDGAWSERPHKWSEVLDVYPCLRPATPADLAEHGVDEQGEPVDAPKPVRQDTPPGLTVTVDGSLLNWEGRNYVPQDGAR